jgi:hypothetical protein
MGLWLVLGSLRPARAPLPKCCPPLPAGPLPKLPWWTPLVVPTRAPPAAAHFWRQNQTLALPEAAPPKTSPFAAQTPIRAKLRDPTVPGWASARPGPAAGERAADFVLGGDGIEETEALGSHRTRCGWHGMERGARAWRGAAERRLLVTCSTVSTLWTDKFTGVFYFKAAGESSEFLICFDYSTVQHSMVAYDSTRIHNVESIFFSLSSRLIL